MQLLLRATSLGRSWIDLVYVDLTPVLIDRIYAFVDKTRESSTAAEWRGTSFAVAGPKLVERIQDNLGPLAAQAEAHGYCRLPLGASLNSNTFFTAAAYTLLELQNGGFSWRVKPVNVDYEVTTPKLPWDLLQE